MALDLPAPADIETVQGVGLGAPRAGGGCTSPCRGAARTGRRPFDLAVRLAAIEVSGQNRRPERAFAAGAPVDVA